jgi:hypothetical protein
MPAASPVRKSSRASWKRWIPPPRRIPSRRRCPVGVLIPQGNTDAISGHSVPLGYGELAINRPRILGRVRRGINAWLACRPVTLGYPESDHQHQEVGVPGCPCVGWPGKSRGSCGPTETPQVCDTAADPHRNPTDETAHSGTLVMPLKGTRNSWSAASMRVSWAVGAFSR